jgi:bifunctional non-homologous end joining protein LigD
LVVAFQRKKPAAIGAKANYPGLIEPELYLAWRKGDDLVYAGKVDHGLDNDIAQDLQARLEPLVKKAQPCSKSISHRGIGVGSSLLAEIEYRARSAEGKVRQPVFKAPREDL